MEEKGAKIFYVLKSLISYFDMCAVKETKLHWTGTIQLSLF